MADSSKRSTPTGTRRQPRAYQICVRCVMDTSDPEILFDRDGHCNHCREFLAVRSGYTHHGGALRADLERIVDEIKASGRDRDHDCVIGMSGGVDSSYLAHLAKNEFGLRPVAVHMDNGWDSPDAVINIRNIVKRLDLTYESYVLDWDEFRDLQLAFLRASVPETETPTDVAIPVALHHVAAKYGIKYVLSAGNLATEGILPKSWHYNARDYRYFEHIRKTFGEREKNGFRFFDYKSELFYKFFKGIKTVYPINYLPFSKNDVVARLARDLDFRYYGQKHHESRYTKFIQSYYLFEKFGIDYRRATFSSQIMDGALSRDEALDQLTQKPYADEEIGEEKRYVAKKLGISGEDLDMIIASPPHWYFDYPNDQGRLAFIYSVYRRLSGKNKLASV
ncbi:MAG TPA: N-acetyl sugar amidotransferase [Pyrinomonadaceae bacterium]|nr:N-acetyl sugar amidotransferase [Pyrinomonadaceae bacterium]